MTTLELRNQLINRITEINDSSFLKALITIIDTKALNQTILLTPELKKEITASKEEIATGKYISHETLENEITAWVNEK